MEVVRLGIEQERIDKIFHIADVHIRNVKRHEEYREVFERFYEAVDKSGTKNSLIVIAGDIAHSKVETSPELMREMSEMLRRCGDLTDTIVIPGNHDCLLTNSSRLDVISPVVDALNHEHVHYVRDNGLFRCKNILFSHYGMFSDADKYIQHHTIPKTYLDPVDTTIALWHGPMDHATTDIGYEVSNKIVGKKMFDGYDMVLLGDIHQYQVVQKYDKKNDLPEIVYPASLVQQNHGENLKGHGYCLWDVKKRSHTHHEVVNDYGFFTADIKDGKIATDTSDIPDKARLRLRCFKTKPTDVKAALTEIRKLSNVCEVSYVRGEAIKDIRRGNIDTIPVAKLNDVDFQNGLIDAYLSNKEDKIDPAIIDEIHKINRIMNDRLTADDVISNIHWIPKLFEFDNMFSYGSDNTIDFKKLEGITGIFAGNASGKSSVLDAFCFCLWDKCSRSFKAADIMNESKNTFKCKINFEIDGVDYYVERKATRNKKGAVKVTVNFTRNVDGEIEPLNDESRRSTNDIIRSYIGSYDDFVLTCLSAQKNNSNFADKGQTDRKDLVSNFLGSGIFDKLHQNASDESKEAIGALKRFDKKDSTKRVADLEDKIFAGESRYNQMVDMKLELVNEKEDLLTEIVHQNSLIESVPVGVVDDIVPLERSIKEKEELISSIDIDELYNSCNNFNVCNEEISEAIEKLTAKDLTTLKNNYDEYVSEHSKLESEIGLLKVDIDNKLDKVKFLDNHEYDPDCEYCNQNEFVQDALEAKRELEDVKPLVVKKISRRNELANLIEDNSFILDDIKEEVQLKQQFQLNESEYHKCISRMKNKEAELESLKLEVIRDKEAIEKYYESKDIIIKNNEIRDEIVKLDTQNKLVTSRIEIATDKIMECNSNNEVLISELKSYQDKIVEAEELERQVKAYQIYLESVSRDGVPYDIIAKSIPAIEGEVNSILSQIVDFSVSIEMDGKNINANIVYEERTWPIEMTSGMESFVSNLAIRIALTNVSNMPKTTFLAIDEGLGALDADVMSSMASLFLFLKDNFDFVLLITHIDSAKDFADSRLEISKTDNFSKICNI